MNRIAPHLLFLLALLCFCIGLCASEPIDVPPWILSSIAMIETRSIYRADGSINYVDRRIGKAGERGPFQIRTIALKDVHLVSMRADVQSDPMAAEFATICYLRLCYKRTGTWWAAVGLYHSSDPDEAREYAVRVWSLRTL